MHKIARFPFQVPARLLLLLAAAHGSAEPPPKAQLALTAHRIQRVLEYHWGGHHPATLDVIVVQAWLSYLGRDWRECISGLQAALYLSAALSVSIEPQDLTALKQLLAVTATDETSKIPAGIPQAPITPKMAGLLRMLAHSKLVLAFDRRSYMRKELMTEEQRASMANSSCMMLQWALDAYDFHFGTRHVMTLTAAREFSMSLLLLIKATKKDAGGTILQRGVDIASQTLQWQVKTLGKHHLETLTTGQLLAVLLANQGRYRRCIAMYEAVIRNAFTRLTLKPSLRRYRPDNEFSRVCWCLPDPYFYGIFETIRPFNRFFLKVKCVLPNLEDEQALVSLNKQPSVVMCGSLNESTGLPLSGGPVSSKPSGREGIGVEKQDAGDLHTKKEVPRDNGVIQLDPADHPIFPSMQSKSASDMISPAIPDLVSDMFVVYINFAVEKQLVSRLVSLFLLLDYLEKQSFRAVSYDIFEIAYTKSGGDVTSHSFLTWLLDLSGTSDKQVMEYIEHYPFRIPREQLLDQDSDIMFLLCHPREDSKGSPPCGCIMDRYLRHLLSKSEVAVSNTCQLILSGNSKKLFEVAQSYSFPLEKLKRAISKLKVVMLMLGKLKEKKDPKEKQDEPDISQMFKRQSTAQAAVSKKLQERVTIGGSFVEQLAENVKETSNRTEMRRRYRHFLAHMRTTLRLPTNLRCEELDILANLMYYYLDIHTFHTWWENRQRSGPDPATRIPRKVTEEDVSAFEEY
ncbi:hypothetical protein, conserved [Eimeria necatrix]|uniref:Uncharacterized protein n=1 Tax=Eimeria necatrix TaxID=51315 RepID=U6N3C5_9EIME|nr:hypothetical protein, conserved [Eimeria necatrix]CDJ69234.1 hypothetical protein, conserved [Eimeria necatrix]